MCQVLENKYSKMLQVIERILIRVSKILKPDSNYLHSDPRYRIFLPCMITNDAEQRSFVANPVSTFYRLNCLLKYLIFLLSTGTAVPMFAVIVRVILFL